MKEGCVLKVNNIDLILFHKRILEILSVNFKNLKYQILIIRKIKFIKYILFFIINLSFMYSFADDQKSFFNNEINFFDLSFNSVLKNKKNPYSLLQPKDRYLADINQAILKSVEYGTNCCPKESAKWRSDFEAMIKPPEPNSEKKTDSRKVLFFVSLYSEITQEVIKKMVRFSEKHPTIFIEGYFVDKWSPEIKLTLLERKQWFDNINGHFIIKSMANMALVMRLLKKDTIKIPAYVFLDDQNTGRIYGLPDLEDIYHKMWSNYNANT